jgi:hypothetical protein
MEAIQVINHQGWLVILVEGPVLPAGAVSLPITWFALKDFMLRDKLPFSRHFCAFSIFLLVNSISSARHYCVNNIFLHAHFCKHSFVACFPTA